jgi:FkbH-like protein
MKTNQFNLSTKRHNRINITKFSEKNKNSIFLGSLKDRYGDHGIVSFIYFFQLDKKTIFIDTFLMSCRILGRHFEAWLLNEIVKKAKERGSDRILTEFVDSGKNSLAKDFLKNYGFKSANLKKDNIPKNLSLDKVKGELFYLKVSEKQISNLEIYEAN